MRTLTFALVALLVSTTFAGRSARAEADGEQRDGTQRNRYDAVVRDKDGRQISYTEAEIDAQARAARRNGTPDPTKPATAKAADPTFAANEVWTYATLGAGIGFSNIVPAQNGAYREIYTGANFDAYWVALRYDPAKQSYEEVFVSDYFDRSYDGPSIRSILVANVTGDAANEIVVTLTDGRVLLYDQATKALLTTVNTSVANVTDVAIADVDNNGANDIVLATFTHLSVFSPAGTLEWDVAVGCSDLVVAQMDNDLALEIALTSGTNAPGTIVDCGTHAVQWTWPNGFGLEITAADVDLDGRAELIGSQGWYIIYAYDVDRHLPKWSISTQLDIGAIAVADVDGDGAPEVLASDGQWGGITAYDGVTQATEGYLQNPEYGMTNIATGDADGDGDLDVLWGAGAGSTGPDYLFVADWNAKQIDWQNDDLVGPFAGPVVGDIDGDGRQEVVVVASGSDAGYGGGRIMVFDARTHQLRTISQQVNGGFGVVYDVKLRDVDGDGRADIMLALSDPYDGVLQAYKYDATSATFVRIFVTASYGLPVFFNIDAGDVDGDGHLEIVAGGGGKVYFFDPVTAAVKWTSLYIGGSSGRDLVIADLDGDGHTEIAAPVQDGDVYVFDAVTKELEAVLFGPFTALALRSADAGLPHLVAGTAAGELVTFSYTPNPNPYPYVETGRQSFLDGSVDGLTIDARGRIWIYQEGALAAFDGVLTAFDASGTLLWSGTAFSGLTSRHPGFVPGSNLFFVSVYYGMVEFAVGSGFGATTAGAYSPATGAFFLKNANASGSADAVFNFGPAAGWTPLVGDWNGDGVETVGLYDPSSGFFYLKNSNAPGAADLTFGYGAGNAGYVPLVGDWNGDGVDTVGLYNPLSGYFFLRNSNASGAANVVFSFGAGNAGYVPLVGDWNGDGVDTVGLYRPSNGFFLLKNTNTSGAADLVYGFGPGGAGWMPLTGDWNGDGVDTVGLYAPSSQYFFLRNSHASGAADVTFGYGAPGLVPLGGDWDGL